jgi:hypothetical protein
MVFINLLLTFILNIFYFFTKFFGGLECVGQSFAHVAHFVFLRDVWIRTQRAAVASKRTTTLATYLPRKMGSYWLSLTIVNVNLLGRSTATPYG